MADPPLVIVGAGHAGGRAAQALQHAGFDGPVRLVGAEPHLPYERPPLSKGVLVGDQQPADCALNAPDFYRDRHIAVDTGRRVARIEPSRRQLVFADGGRQPYRRLLLTTGGRARRLPIAGAELSGVVTLRSIDDCLALRARLVPGAAVAIVGGGLIGLEVAAGAVKRGCAVTVIEAAPTLMGRVVPAEIAALLHDRHSREGVRIHLGARPTGFVGDGRVEAVDLEGGDRIPADVVVVAIGITPAVELAEQAGLEVANGIVVDAGCRTSDPDIFAAGDAACAFHPLYGRHIRLESWQNAEKQSVLAARNMIGGGEDHTEVPWMWSDQYDLMLQVSGLTDRYDDTVRRGSLADDGRVVLFLLDGGRLVAACGLGVGTKAGRDIRVAQRLIARGTPPDPAALADPAVNLKTLLRA